ncbi:MAG TPA: hypothetical protein ENI68_05100 [Gammaproteobacteria bacterium]|nr:hypothetical protein [Gammaproteobacteria bacterium]
MALHEDKQCPRCQQLFECKSGSITLCHCAETPLPGDILEALRLRYDDCLCAACLQEIQASILRDHGHSFLEVN